MRGDMSQEEIKDPYLDQIVKAYNLNLEKLHSEAIEPARYLSLMHCAKEIYDKNIKGSVCEAGVYKGLFAQYINGFFNDRTLHLYDTFCGFIEGEVKYDFHFNYLSGKHDMPSFSRDNNLELVKALMPHLDKCVFHIGRIPETLDYSSSEKFCFVSIDCDLHLPTFNCLEYFYPRVNVGGYIFVHDYNHGAGDFYGIREAIKRYQNMYKIELKYVPLSDFSGTVVIAR
jgi:O-methyltransferase